MTNRPFVSVLLPNWNGSADVLECLESLSDLDYPKERLEVVVVDNASSDGSPVMIRDQFRRMRGEGWKRLELISLRENVGIPGAYNVGFKEISPRAEAILRIETDVVVAREALKYMVGTLQREDRAGAVGAMIIDYATRERNCGAITFNVWTQGFQVTFPEAPIECQGVLGCAMLVRRRVADHLKYLFDESLMICSDETDLSLRLAERGYTTWCEPRAVVYHKGGRSTRKVGELARYYSVRNGALLTRRYSRFPYRWSRYLLMALWGLKRLIRGDYLVMRALVDGFILPIDPSSWTREERKWKSI